MILLELGFVLVLVLMNGFFAMSEMAIVSSRRLRLLTMAEQGHSGARVALQLYDEPSRFLSAVQIGITLVGTLAAAVSGATIAEQFGATLNAVPWIAPNGETWAFVIVVMAITTLSVIVGELVPKRIALANPEPIAAAVAKPLLALSAMFRPVVSLMQAASAGILWLIGVRPTSSQGVTEEEVKTVLAEGAEAGVIAQEERRMLEEVLRLSDRSVASVMTPRRDIWWIDADDPLAKILDELKECPFSRIVVGQAGGIEEPLGVVQKKDLLAAALDGKPLDIRAAMREPIYVPETSTAWNLLQLFKQQPLHIALVVDEYGSLMGIVTPTDLLSAIAGELQEEHFDNSPSVVEREDGSFLVDGRCELQELETVTGLKADEDADYHTAAGLALSVFRKLPGTGETIEHGGWRIEVVDMDGPRIDKLLIKRI
jgi:putative hemolysin